MFIQLYCVYVHHDFTLINYQADFFYYSKFISTGDAFINNIYYGGWLLYGGLRT